MRIPRVSRKLLFVFVLIIFSLVLVSQASAAVEPVQEQTVSIAPSLASTNPTAVIATGALNVRSGPGVGYGIVAVVYQGQSVTLLGRNNSSSWANVQLANEVKGWVNAFYIQASVAIGSLPVVTTPALTPTAIVATSALNVRSGPGVGYGIVTVISYGQSMSLTGRNSSGSWVQIQLSGGQQGWVNASLIYANVTISSLPVAGTPALTPTAVITASALNVRSGPGVGYGVVAVASYGQSVSLTGRNSSSSWAQIQLSGGQQGWVNASYILANVSISSLPVVGTPTLTATAVIVTGALNVRYGPGVGYTVKTIVYQGEVVALIGRNSNGSWVNVQLSNGQQGWVNAAYIQANVTISNLPVTE